MLPDTLIPVDTFINKLTLSTTFYVLILQTRIYHSLEIPGPTDPFRWVRKILSHVLGMRSGVSKRTISVQVRDKEVRVEYSDKESYVLRVGVTEKV